MGPLSYNQQVIQYSLEAKNVRLASHGARRVSGRCPREAGFSLLQLLVTIGIAGILLAAASPNIATVTRVYGVRSGARQVYSDLQNARRRPSRLDEFRSRAAELNRRILSYNLKCPSAQVHKWPLDIETEMQRLG